MIVLLLVALGFLFTVLVDNFELLDPRNYMAFVLVLLLTD